MPLIVETLRQEEWWYGADGFPHRLGEMELSHLWNVVNFLTRHASQLRLQHYWCEFLEYNDLDASEVGPHTQVAFHEWLRGQNEIEASPVAWLDATPLVRALRRELLTRATTDGDVVGVRYDEELEDGSSGTNGRAGGTDPGLRGRPALG